MYKVGKGEWADNSDRNHHVDINIGHYVSPQCHMNSNKTDVLSDGKKWLRGYYPECLPEFKNRNSHAFWVGI